MSAIQDGHDLMLFIKGATDYKVLAHSTSVKLKTESEMKDVISKSTGKNGTKKVKKINFSLSTDCLLTVDQASYKLLLDAQLAKKELEFKFGIPANYSADGNEPIPGYTAPTAGYQGKVLIASIDLTAGSDDDATYTVELTGIGDLTPISA